MTYSKKKDMKNKTNAKQDISENIEDKQEIAKPTTSKEYGGPKGLEPTRYGDWERKGRCIDF
ncbi:MAG: DUF1674 domain-containing protein [Gammaproteobacteria bacterium]|jgi:hypothetical protein